MDAARLVILFAERRAFLNEALDGDDPLRLSDSTICLAPNRTGEPGFFRDKFVLRHCENTKCGPSLHPDELQFVHVRIGWSMARSDDGWNVRISESAVHGHNEIRSSLPIADVSVDLLPRQRVALSTSSCARTNRCLYAGIFAADARYCRPSLSGWRYLGFVILHRSPSCRSSADFRWTSILGRIHRDTRNAVRKSKFGSLSGVAAVAVVLFTSSVNAP